MAQTSYQWEIDSKIVHKCLKLTILSSFFQLLSPLNLFVLNSPYFDKSFHYPLTNQIHSWFLLVLKKLPNYVDSTY